MLKTPSDKVNHELICGHSYEVDEGVNHRKMNIWVVFSVTEKSEIWRRILGREEGLVLGKIWWGVYSL